MAQVSSVEIAKPALTRRALECANWVFAESVSGWGSDLLLGPAVRAACGPMSVGVIGSVAIRHTAPVQPRRRHLCALLRRYGVDPGHEANRVAVDFGVERFLRPLAPGEAEACRGPLDRETALIIRSLSIKQSRIFRRKVSTDRARRR